MNRIILSGYIVSDIDAFRIEGIRKTSFYLSVYRYWNEKNQVISSTDKIDVFKCVAYGKNAQFIEEHCFNGVAIQIEGRLTSNKIVVNKSIDYSSEIVIDRIEFFHSKEHNEELKRALFSKEKK